MPRQPYAPLRKGPSAAEWAAHRQAELDEEARYRSERARIEQEAIEASRRLIPKDPTTAILERLAALEEKVQVLQNTALRRIEI